MPRKRKRNEKAGSSRPTKKRRKNLSTDSDEVELSSGPLSSEYDVLFEEEQQSHVRTTSNRGRNASHNRQAFDNSRRDSTRRRENVSPRNGPRCSLRLLNQRALRNKSPATTSRRGGGNREEECRKLMAYTRCRPRCTPRRLNYVIDLSIEPSDDDWNALISRRDTSTSRRVTRSRKPHNHVQYNQSSSDCQALISRRDTSTSRRVTRSRKPHNQVLYNQSSSDCHALISRRDTSTSRRVTRSRKPHNHVQYNQLRQHSSPTRQTHARQSLRNKSSQHSSSRRNKRARDKISQSSSSSSSLATESVEGTENIAPDQFFFMYYEPGLESQNTLKRQYFTGQQQSQENNNSDETSENCPEQVQDPLPEASLEQPASFPNVELENLDMAENEQRLLQTESQPQSDSELERQSPLIHIILLRQPSPDLEDAEGTEIDASGDGPHVIDRSTVTLVVDGDLLEMRDQFESPQSSNVQIPNLGEEHQEYGDAEQNDNQEN